jgi:magnesium transporter
MYPASPQVRGFLLLAATTQGRVAGMDNLPTLTTATFIGIVVAISGNVLISLALNLQKLAHKRIEARILARQKPSRQDGKANDDGPPNGRRGHRYAEGLDLDENDEDRLQRHPEESSHNNNAPETQSLFSFPNTSSPISDYGATLYEQRISFGQPLSTSERNDSFSRRLHPDADDDVLSQDTSPLPVNIVSDEFAPNQQGPRRKLSSERVDVAVDSNETEYLRSKLWYVLSPISTFILPQLRV